MLFEKPKHGCVMRLGIAGPVYVNAVGRGALLELPQVLIEIAQSVALDLRGKGAHLLPSGDFGCNFVAAHTRGPQTTVVAHAVRGVGNEPGTEFYLVHLFHESKW